jgi:serine/threonine-protein kinase
MRKCLTLEAGMEPYPGYHLVRFLGCGGFAEVWQAESATGSSLALKFLTCTDSRSAPQEIRSLQAVRHLRHPNLIHIDRVWGYLNFIVIAMELADGSLADLLEAYQTEFHTPIAGEQTCLYLAQVAAALDFLNTRQHYLDGKTVAVQHCDVKPSNILVCGEVIKLADFGLSALTTSQLRLHRRAGTLEYTAPEVFQGQLSDRTDQYALAVTYCELRGGRMPFPNTPKKFERGYVRPPADLSMLPAEERPIVARALSLCPHDRWSCCAAFIAQLARLMT